MMFLNAMIHVFLLEQLTMYGYLTSDCIDIQGSCMVKKPFTCFKFIPWVW
jgi:hypothetical protein